MRRTCACLVVSLGLLVSSRLSAQTIDSTVLQTFLNATVKNDQIPGALLSVLPIGGAAGANLTSGVANLQTNAPLQSTMLYRLGSTTKTYTATVVLQLVGEGALIPGTKLPLTLDTTATQVLGSQVLSTIPYASQVTIRNLLNMTSGIYDYNDDAFQAVIYANPSAAWTPQQILATLQGKPPVYQPGFSCGQCPNSCVANTNCWNYSNTNYIILGLIIEAVTSDTIANQIQTKILTPLGLANTSFPLTPTLTGNFANGYTAAGITNGCGPVVPKGGQYNDSTMCFNPTSAWAAGAMVSNFTDMQKWLKALLSGTLLTPAMQQQRLTFVQGNLETIPIQFGLGIMQVQAVNGNPTTTFQGHAGEFWGYSNVAMQGINSGCSVQVLDAVNAFQGVMVNGQEPAPYAELFFYAGGVVCGGQTSAAATRTTRSRTSNLSGFLF